MKAPQIVWLMLMATEFTHVIVKYGEPKGNFNIWTTLASLIIINIILYWGGFFT